MSEREEPLPSRIGRYEPLKRLAVGGMAEIFLAKQTGLEGFEKVVVLKRILGNLATDDEFVSMFLDEARIAAKLSHPNIVQIYDLDKADNTYYIAMEYVSGRNVQHLINKQQSRGGHLPVEHVIRIMAGVCDGLYYAHSRKDYNGLPLSIIHRDISPQNILVSFAGGVKVVDFGIAKASTQLAQTRAGVLKGKYAYMSPEQVRGAKIDHRSDLFAVGLVMYEMLTGMRAFERDSSLKTLKAIVQEKPLNPREMNPEIPMEVVKLLSKALEKNPDRRYKTAQEMQLALEDWLESAPKKSNNVRLSRFLYDLFDDELASAEGTMVVKGVGQVIIPTSQGEAKAKPAFEEEVDSKTLSAALVDEKPVPPGDPLQGRSGPGAPDPRPSTSASAASSRVRDELSAKQAAPPAARPAPKTPKPTPPPQVQADDDDNDGKTMPGYDLEQLERDRVAMMAKKGIAPSSAQVAPGPLTAEEEGEDEDKTKAGVPMSDLPQAPVQARGPAPAAPKNRNQHDDSDARARAMLEMVESIAPPTMSRAQPPAIAAAGAASRAGGMSARTASLPDQEPQNSSLDEAPLPPPAPRWEGNTKETPRGNSMSGDDMIVGSGGAFGGVGDAPGAGPGGREPSRRGLGRNAQAQAAAQAATDDIDASHMPGWGGGPGVDAMLQGGSPLERFEGQVPAVARAPARPPAAFYAAVGASAGMAAVAVILFVVGFVAFPGAIPPADYGVVAITSTPATTVVLDGVTVKTPGQLVVPLDGVERTLSITQAGWKPREAKVAFAPGEKVLKLDVVLEPAGS